MFFKHNENPRHTQFYRISDEKACITHVAYLSLLGYLRRRNALYRSVAEPAEASELLNSSSVALHENCGHVPEAKTQPQNTDCITRRITVDYIPLSKGARCQRADRKFRKFHRGNHFQPRRRCCRAARYTATSTNWGRTGTTLGILQIICTQSVGRAAGTRKRKRE